MQAHRGCGCCECISTYICFCTQKLTSLLVCVLVIKAENYYMLQKGLVLMWKRQFSFSLEHSTFSADSLALSLCSPPLHSPRLSFSTAHYNETQQETPFKEGKKDVSKWCKWTENVFLLLRNDSYSAD